MIVDRYIIEVKLVRSFSVGFTIYSFALNGIAADFKFACFHLGLYGRGNKFFGATNYWNG